MMRSLHNSTVEEPKKRWTRAELVSALACLAIAILLFAMPALRFLSLHSNFFDLGQYTQYHHWLAFGGAWSEIVSNHAHPAAIPYILAFRILPSGLTLLALQSALLVASAFLYMRLWRASGLSSPWFGALLYLLSFPVWFGVLFDFHFEHLIFPIIFGFFLVVETKDGIGARFAAIALGLSLCLIKEVYPLSAAMLGIYLVASKRWIVTGLALIALSSAYFIAMTTWIIPAFSQDRGIGELWGSAFGYLGPSMASIATRLLLEPWLPLSEILLTPRKMLYVGVLFATFAFLPLRKPLTLLPALPILAISLLSRNPNHYYLGHQYTVMVAAVSLVAVAQVLGSWKEPLRWRAMVAVFGCTIGAQIAFGPSPISRLFWSPNIFNYHWTAYRIDERSERINRLIETYIPKNDEIAVSMQNSLNSDRLSNRNYAFAFPDGVFAPVPIRDSDGQRKVWADYVVLDGKRPLSIRDDICVYRPRDICTDGPFRARYEGALRNLANDHEVLHEEDGLIIFRRRVGANESWNRKNSSASSPDASTRN